MGGLGKSHGWRFCLFSRLNVSLLILLLLLCRFLFAFTLSLLFAVQVLRIEISLCGSRCPAYGMMMVFLVFFSFCTISRMQNSHSEPLCNQWAPESLACRYVRGIMNHESRRPNSNPNRIPTIPVLYSTTNWYPNNHLPKSIPLPLPLPHLNSTSLQQPD